MHTNFTANLLAGCLLLLASIVQADEPQPTISVNGSAEIRVMPDEVVILAAVESRAKTLAAAAAENDAKIAQVLEFLKTAGVGSENIHTEFIGIEPIMNELDQHKLQIHNLQNARPLADSDIFKELEELLQPLGYDVRRRFRIRITDLAKFENVYRGLIERGINQVDGIQFNSSERRKYRDQARVNAVRAAKEKATLMAAELGATINAVKTIGETRYGAESAANLTQNYSIVVPANIAWDDDGSFAAGQIHITASVDVVFYLGNANMDD